MFYKGEFGFDKFESQVCAEGTYSDYQPLLHTVPKEELVKDEKIHLSAYASMYPPGVEGNQDNKKSTITVYVLAKESKTKLKNASKVRFSSSTPTAIKIVGNDTLTLTINDVSPQALTLECLQPFDKDVVITAIAEGDVFVLGQLIIKANAKRYSTIIQPVEIVFSSQENLNVVSIPNAPLFKELEKKFNNNSFNQAYIYGELAPQTQKIIVNKKEFLDQGYLFELNGLLYGRKVEKDDKDKLRKEFNSLIESKYTSALNKISTGNPEELKNQIEKQKIKLLETFDKEFDYKLGQDLVYAQKKHQEKIVTKAWNHPKVQAEYSKYLKLKQQYNQNGGTLPLNKHNTLHLFYSKDIHGGGDSSTIETDDNGTLVLPRLVQAYSLLGTGVCYVFDSGLKAADNITTILHELGHSLGLEHPFEKSLGNYEKRIKNKRYKEDIETEIKELEDKIVEINQPQPIQSGTNAQHLYNSIKRGIEYNRPGDHFEKLFLNAIMKNPKNEGALISEEKHQFYLDSSQELSATQAQTKEELKNKLKVLKIEKETADGLVVYPNWKTQSETLDNYMDYYQKANSSDINPDFERKSYTQKQWRIIQEKGVEITVLKTITQ
ncbi:hypothetical protein HUE46_01635 [Flavobacterium columnare]|uniref:hypothetical protein n=1 Tax=Flavobacterium columnare TaxID=996 RepID=UPI00177DA074|nr:hypothetical protein [Flavobacterium columnare]QOG88825.1 hypothetical protein HUE41_01635 [Flavobacterium columnare]QOG91484.1 hypothetical protein HUE42_01630 [Flavobacterium columnare]QOG94147.1 hypothetical protein HUE43_01635 [Flavobacterium columnare]QOG96806.1 hypothetical protein HUE44_01630 [Flavobacterium columnare]QOG99464.1 hypothetical protein HUE45_01630 [Flavobacterium columnare]